MTSHHSSLRTRWPQCRSEPGVTQEFAAAPPFKAAPAALRSWLPCFPPAHARTPWSRGAARIPEPWPPPAVQPVAARDTRGVRSAPPAPSTAQRGVYTGPGGQITFAAAKAGNGFIPFS